MILSFEAFSMRIAFWTIPSILTIASVLGLQICSAQAAKAVSSAAASSTAGCTGLPYSAKETITYPAHLHTANGPLVEYKEVHLLWRDAVGRTRTETVSKTTSGAEYHHVVVYEPVKRATWTWFSGNESSKVVHVRPFRESEASPSCPTLPTPQSLKTDMAARNPGSGTTTEILPPETISGLPVLGNRTTTLIPVGAHDKKGEIKVMTREFWISPDLGVIVRHTTDSPDTGKFVSELSDIKRSVPDPALFKVPDGYEMRVDPPPPPSALDEITREIKPVLPQPPPIK
jgi:hypothetical protein